MVKDITQYKFLEKIKSLPFVEEIWLFGSRARRDHQERSDIDLAILCPKATHEDWNKVLDIVEDADTLLQIDCVRFEKDRISEDFCNNILRDKKVLYS
jgi:uncharacterized protein